LSRRPQRAIEVQQGEIKMEHDHSSSMQVTDARKKYVKIRTNSTCPTKTQTVVKVRKFEVVIDEPASNHGQDRGPQPLEYLLSSLAGCTNVIINKICHDRGFDISDLEIDVAGYLDARGIFGKEDVRVPFPEIELTVRGRTKNSPPEIASLGKELAWRCPVSVVLRQSGTKIVEFWDIQYG
jgi:putative redox protein